MVNAKWLSKALVFVVCLTGCQDAYVAPTYDVNDMISQIQQHHKDVEARSKNKDAEGRDVTGMLHHSLHEMDATLKRLIAHPESQSGLSPDKIVTMRAIANELLVAYRKLDDDFHKSYSIEFESKRESLEMNLQRLDEFRDAAVPGPQ